MEPIDNPNSECYRCEARMCDALICPGEQYYYNIEHGEPKEKEEEPPKEKKARKPRRKKLSKERLDQMVKNAFDAFFGHLGKDK